MNRIKELRKSKGISQFELSKVLGVSQQSISTYENNTRNLDIEDIKTLAETEIEHRYDDADGFITNFKYELNKAGYDFEGKSAEEIAEIIILALKMVEKIKGSSLS